MASVTNKQIAAAFISAKNNLSSGCHDENREYLSPYICGALALADDHTVVVRKVAKDVIEKRLGRCHTVTKWLYHNGYLTNDSFDADGERAKQIQLYRHRWLDSLIKEFSV